MGGCERTGCMPCGTCSLPSTLWANPAEIARFSVGNMVLELLARICAAREMGNPVSLMAGTSATSSLGRGRALAGDQNCKAIHANLGTLHHMRRVLEHTTAASCPLTRALMSPPCSTVKRGVMWFAFQRTRQPERIKEVLQMVYARHDNVDDELVTSIEVRGLTHTVNTQQQQHGYCNALAPCHCGNRFTVHQQQVPKRLCRIGVRHLPALGVHDASVCARALGCLQTVPVRGTSARQAHNPSA